jgi:hypothetical protein
MKGDSTVFGAEATLQRASAGSTNDTSLGVNRYWAWACEHGFLLHLGLDSRGLYLKPHASPLVNQ